MRSVQRHALSRSVNCMRPSLNVPIVGAADRKRLLGQRTDAVSIRSVYAPLRVATPLRRR